MHWIRNEPRATLLEPNLSRGIIYLSTEPYHKSVGSNSRTANPLQTPHN
jgi:hypothetical protein